MTLDKKVRVTVYVSERYAESLTVLARAEGRSVSQMAAWIIEQRLRDREGNLTLVIPPAPVVPPVARPDTRSDFRPDFKGK